MKIGKRVVSVLIIGLISLCACQSVVFLFYGVRKPHPVSSKKIDQKAIRLGIDTNRLYSIRPKYYPKLLHEIGTFPNIRTYDSNGLLYNYWESPDECKSGAASFIETMNPDSVYRTLNDSSFFRLQEQIERLHGGDFDLEQLPDADYYAVIFWGTMLGKVNNQYVEPWIQKSKQNPNARIHLIFVSCDIRREWGKDYWKLWERTE